MRFLGSSGADRGTLGGSETETTKGMDVWMMRNSQDKGGGHKEREEDGSEVRERQRALCTK